MSPKLRRITCIRDTGCSLQGTILYVYPRSRDEKDRQFYEAR